MNRRDRIRFDLYEDLLRSLAPRVRWIALHGPDAEPRWTTAPHLTPDHHRQVESLLARARSSRPDPGGEILALADGGHGLAFALERDDESLGLLVLALGAATPTTLDTSRALLRPAVALLLDTLAAAQDAREVRTELDAAHAAWPWLAASFEPTGPDERLEGLLASLRDALHAEQVLAYLPTRRRAIQFPARTPPGELGEAVTTVLNPLRLWHGTQGLRTPPPPASAARAIVMDVPLPGPPRERQPLGVLAVARDAAQPFEPRERVLLLAFAARAARIVERDYDALTGLLGRGGLQQAYHELVGRPLGLVYGNLRATRRLNAGGGRAAGDRALALAARALLEVLPPTAVLARVESDRFAMLLPGVEPDELAAYARRAGESVGRLNVDAGGRAVTLGLRVGTAHGRGRPLDALLSAAEEAAAAADPIVLGATGAAAPVADVASARPRVTLHELADALEHGRFELWLQAAEPLRDADRPRRYEALLRLVRPDGTRVEAAEFLALAERADLLARLDAWALESLCAHLEAEDVANVGDAVAFALNVSGATLGDAGFAARLAARLAAARIPPHALSFEIPERVLDSPMPVESRTLHALRELGCGLTLDGLGADGPSLGRLRTWPVNRLKFDGALAVRAATDAQARQAMRATVDTAAGLGIETIAARVESLEALQRSREAGVDFAQGYAVARPRPLAYTLASLAHAVRH